jgi:hypothetical protein
MISRNKEVIQISGIAVPVRKSKKNKKIVIRVGFEPTPVKTSDLNINLKLAP